MIKIKIILFLILSTSVFAKTLNINEHTKFYDLLPHTKIYEDKTRSLTIDDIIKKDKEFVKNEKKLLGYGYSPDFDVWIKFTLHNESSRIINKILEYDNSMTTNITFYEKKENKSFNDGLLNINENRKTLNPIFKIQLKPYESKTYYIKASSHVTTLIIKLNLWEDEEFYNEEIKHQAILALFFGSMIILGLYNLFIYFFTKDISYLYYVMYIFSITLHHLMYVGIAHIYFIKHEWLIYSVEYASIFIVFPILSLALFSKSFLNVKQYPIWNKILKLFIVFLPITLFIFLVTDDFNKYRNMFPFSFLIFLMGLTIYAAFRKNRQAYFVFFGWFVFLTAGMFMYLSSIGIFNIYQYTPYYVEFALVLEAIIFSIALADKIKQLQQEKNEANKKLIFQQQNETERLEIKVEEKTRDLKKALDEKGLLLKELNHRVKNNMQTVVSLIRLQVDEVNDKRLEDMLVTVQNRVNAMGQLHDMLYKQDSITHINAYEYFDALIEELKRSYESEEVEISFDIQTELKMEEAIYCGLILNELVTNSFKYAFPDGVGDIKISLYKDEKLIRFLINDNGVGFEKPKSTNSLGMVLVNTLAKEQLDGDINISTTDGVEVDIVWEERD